MKSLKMQAFRLYRKTTNLYKPAQHFSHTESSSIYIAGHCNLLSYFPKTQLCCKSWKATALEDHTSNFHALNVQLKSIVYGFSYAFKGS